jgi:transposase-like protein
MPQSRPSVDLLTLVDAYDTDLECRTYLEELRWPKGVICPRCESATISRIKARKVFDCDSCRYQFSVTAGTLFHDSHLPLPKWFLVVFLMCESENGMSANQLKRMLKVSYKTAWYLCHRIRGAMTDSCPQPLTSTVEVHDTFIGGGRSMGSGYRDRHAMILAAVQRGGMIRMTKGERRTKETLHSSVDVNVSPGLANIYTDEAPDYTGIGDENTTHQTVNHGNREYARGDVDTQTLESAFSLFKRSIVGSFHQISEKHVDRYLDEFEFRFKNRKNPYQFRDVLLRLTDAKAMPYSELTEERTPTHV